MRSFPNLSPRNGFTTTQLIARPRHTMFSEERIWGARAEGFQKLTDGRGNRMLVRADLAGQIAIAQCLDERHSEPVAGLQGRAGMRTIRLASGAAALIRRYHHGGLLRGLTGRCFASWPPRPFRELTITEELRHRGFPTVEVYAACVEKFAGPFYRGYLMTRQLDGAQDLWSAIQQGVASGAAMADSMRSVARTVRAMHRHGVYHRDLNLKNILVRAGTAGIESYVIDFDRALLVLGPVPELLARRNLERLRRSIRKLDPRLRYFPPAAWDELVRSYADAEN
jgi:3-deoxy-D-manno-octulosonic acid kinase